MSRTRGNSQKIQHRRGSAAEWAVTNPVLLAGELGYETDTTRLKFGDGGSQWTALPYVGSYGANALDGLSDVAITSPLVGAVLRYDGAGWVDYVLSKTDIGLGNVDNTSDINKPVSTAQSADATSKANAAQAYAIQRGNHTGTQGVSTITASATDRLLGRSSAGAGVVEEIACTAAGRALLDDADNAAQRTTLGLGTMATQSAASVAITGGSINGTSIGATAASSGVFTTIGTYGLIASNQGITAAGARSRFRALNEQFAVGAGFSSGSGLVYFGARNESATPDAVISSAGGITLMTLADSRNVSIGGIAPVISSGIGFHVGGSTIRMDTARTPANSSATGNQGELCWDSSYLYVCTATNTWRRIAHSTW